MDVKVSADTDFRYIVISLIQTGFYIVSYKCLTC